MNPALFHLLFITLAAHPKKKRKRKTTADVREGFAPGFVEVVADRQGM